MNIAPIACPIGHNQCRRSNVMLYIATRLHGYTATRLHGYTTTWLHGYIVNFISRRCSRDVARALPKIVMIVPITPPAALIKVVT